MARGNNVLQIVINGVNRAGPAFRSVAAGLTKIGLAATAAFAGATLRATQFEKGLAEISTLLDGDTTPAVAKMRKELLQLTIDFGQTMGKMTKARYDIVSAGFTDAADSAAVLEAASKLAVAGVSDVASTADLLTTAINGLGLEAQDAEAVADVLFQTVRKGKTTMDQLASSFGVVFASARVAGVNLQELGAVMATLTANGINTAESATALNNLLRALAAPSGEAKDLLQDLGITLDNGLMPALEALSVVGDEGLSTLAKFIPNIRALKAAAVAASDVEKLTANLQSMYDATGQVNAGFETMSETFDFKFKQFRASLDSLITVLGEAFLPTLKEVVDKGTEFATLLRFMADATTEDGVPAFKAFADVLVNDVKEALLSVGGVLGWIIDQVAKAFDAPKVARFNEAVDTLMNDMRQDTQWMKDMGFATEMTKRIDTGFRSGVTIDTNLLNVDEAAFRKWAEEKVRASFESSEAMTGVSETFTQQLRRMMDEWVATAKEAKRAAVEATDIVVQAEREPPRPRADFPRERGDQGTGRGGGLVITEEEKTEEEKRIDDLREYLADLAKFTIEDFMNMAFTIGDAFGTVFGEITNHLLGLREGPLMLGRMFKQMAASIISDLARIIARMLVARFLLSFFGLGTGGGVVGSGLRSMAGFAHGGTVRHAAAGLPLLAGSAGRGFGATILPGTAGLDGTPVLAQGGEMFVSREQTNQMRSMLKVERNGRNFRGRSRGGMQKVEINMRADRPFRREEQIRLNDSIADAASRTSRHGG